MIPALLSNLMGARRPGLALAAAAALGFAGCKDATTPAPDTGVAYYPVAVGNYWVYAVADTVWSQASVQGSTVTPSVATVSAFQFKEAITGTFSDAAGATAYRMVRSRRATANDAWVDDSVFVLSATPQSVILNRNNQRTLELIFPVRQGRSWNFNAYNNNSNDTITAETRQYSQVGQPFTTSGGPGNPPAATYPTTLTTQNTGTATQSSLLRRVSYRQVYARTIGPVFRRRVNLSFFNYVNPTNGNQVYPPNAYSIGSSSRRETLIDYGPR